MLEKLTEASFSEHVGSTFAVRVDSCGPVEIELVECKQFGGDAKAQRRPFSLLFRGAKGLDMPQQIYTLEHERLGSLEIFIVPIGPVEGGMGFEAVFT